MYLYNIIKIHNNNLWDWQYSTEYSCIFSTFGLNVEEYPRIFLWNNGSPTEHCFEYEWCYVYDIIWFFLLNT